MSSHFFTGLVGGLAIAAPVGPIGMLCIRRSVTDGRKVGFACGLGAATADALYGAVAAFGLTTISHILLAEEMWVELIGGLILVWIGVAALRARPEISEPRPAPGHLRSAYLSTLLLTLMNPMTILSFLAVFAGLGLGRSAETPSEETLLVLGVFLGSVTWWLVVSLAGGWLRRRFQDAGMRVVNIVAGTVIAGIGAWQVAEFARHFHW
ncbi:MAG TPA: LysE family transporter [Opitutaceae bacterium]|nr:LysE family transporter [Opitutaceae bacterium]